MNTNSNESPKNVNPEVVVKKRGRPKKVIEPVETTKDKKKNGESDVSTKEIILHLPVMKKTEDKKTINGGSNKNDLSDGNTNNSKSSFTIEDFINTNAKNNKINNKVAMTMSSDENSESTEDTDGFNAVIKLKNKMIKKLQTELSELKKMVVNERENKVYNMNVKLIDTETHKSIICEKTNICCWHCTYEFDTMPCFITTKKTNDIYHVFGCFCSFNCALAYNFSLGDYKMQDRFSLTNKLYEAMFGISNEDIQMAPKKEILTKYGGPITIENYRKNFKLCSKNYNLNIPLMMNIIPQVEEKYKDDYYKKN